MSVAFRGLPQGGRGRAGLYGNLIFSDGFFDLRSADSSSYSSSSSSSSTSFPTKIFHDANTLPARLDISARGWHTVKTHFLLLLLLSPLPPQVLLRRHHAGS